MDVAVEDKGVERIQRIRCGEPKREHPKGKEEGFFCLDGSGVEMKHFFSSILERNGRLEIG